MWNVHFMPLHSILSSLDILSSFFHFVNISFNHRLLKFIPKNLDFLVLRTGTWVKSWAPFARHGFVLSCAARSVCSVGEAQDLRGNSSFRYVRIVFLEFFGCKTPNFWCWISGHQDKGLPAVFQARGARGARSWIWRHGLEVWYFNLVAGRKEILRSHFFRSDTLRAKDAKVKVLLIALKLFQRHAAGKFLFEQNEKITIYHLEIVWKDLEFDANIPIGP